MPLFHLYIFGRGQGNEEKGGGFFNKELNRHIINDKCTDNYLFQSLSLHFSDGAREFRERGWGFISKEMNIIK